MSEPLEVTITKKIPAARKDVFEGRFGFAQIRIDHVIFKFMLH